MLRFSFVVCMLAACGGGSGGGGDDVGPDGGGGNEPLVNGVPASQYYASFTYAKSHTAVEGAVAFPETNGHDAFLATFFLMPGGDVQLFYAEGSGDVTTTGWSLNLGTKTKRTATWKVQGARLVLEPFMTCDGMDFNAKPALRCTLDTAVQATAAQGHAGTFRNRSRDASPDDSEFAGYTP